MYDSLRSVTANMETIRPKDIGTHAFQRQPICRPDRRSAEIDPMYGPATITRERHAELRSRCPSSIHTSENERAPCSKSADPKKPASTWHTVAPVLANKTCEMLQKLNANAVEMINGRRPYSCDSGDQTVNPDTIPSMKHAAAIGLVASWSLTCRGSGKTKVDVDMITSRPNNRIEDDVNFCCKDQFLGSFGSSWPGVLTICVGRCAIVARHSMG